MFVCKKLIDLKLTFFLNLLFKLNRPQGSTPALLTPTAKRKNLLLQHQQRSSMDTDALELEDHFSDQVSLNDFNDLKERLFNLLSTKSCSKFKEASHSMVSF